MRIKWVVPLLVVSFCVGLAVTAGVLYAAEGPRGKADLPELTYADFTAHEHDYDVIGFGTETLFTSTLMRSRVVDNRWVKLTMGELFANKAADVLAKWSANCDAIGPDSGFNPAKVEQAKAALASLQREFKNPPYDTMTYKALYLQDWKSAPKPIVEAFQLLERAGMQVPFLSYTEGEATLTGVINGLAKQGFENWDLGDLMYTPAGPWITEPQIDAVNEALHVHHVLLAYIPDITVEKKADGTRHRIPKPGNNPLCCNKTTRVCGNDPTRICTTCGAICCLGSQWCP